MNLEQIEKEFNIACDEQISWCDEIMFQQFIENWVNKNYPQYEYLLIHTLGTKHNPQYYLEIDNFKN